jgi:hypothetical protein
MTTEPIFLPVAPHSVESEFLLLMDKYRGIVEKAGFDRLGRPSFFDAAVNLILGRVAQELGRDPAKGWLFRGKSRPAIKVKAKNWRRKRASSLSKLEFIA